MLLADDTPKTATEATTLIVCCAQAAEATINWYGGKFSVLVVPVSPGVALSTPENFLKF